MIIPEVIKRQKPKMFGASEIRYIGGYYYVYLVSSKWDAEKGRSRKVTGKSVGKITEADGFIPNANGMRQMQKIRTVSEATPVVKTYGAYAALQQLAPDISNQLKKYFPDIFREIRTFALLRLVDGVSSAKMVKPFLLDSYLSDMCPDISSSEGTVRQFIARLGLMQDRLDTFMKAQIIPGATLLFDGTSIFTRSSDSLAAKGYNPRHNQNTQARILHVFERESNKPVFYRVVQGSVVDKSAFLDVVNTMGDCKDSIIIADKGFYSTKNVSALSKVGARYIMPLQSNTTLVDNAFYLDNEDSKWDGVFTYKKRAIWCKKTKCGTSGNFIYTFRDDSRKADMVGRFVEKAEKDYGEEEYVPTDVLKDARLGYFSFYSNLDATPQEIYLSYKKRWDIEQCFDYLKNSVSTASSYAQTDEYFRGWAFLNHISLMYYYSLLNAMRNSKLDGKWSAEDILKLMKNIYLVDSGDNLGYRLSSVQKKTQELLDLLGIDLLSKI